MCWQDRGSHLLFPVSRILLDPPSRETSKVGVLPSDRLTYSSVSVARRKNLVRSSPPHTIFYVRTPYYENTSVRCRRLMGLIGRRGAARFIRFTRLPGSGGVLRRLCIKFLPAAVALRLAAFLTFLPATTSPAICAPVVSARFPQSDSTSSDQRGNRSEETTEQTSKPVPPLDTSASKVGQCPTHLPRIVVVVIHLNNPELHRRK